MRLIKLSDMDGRRILLAPCNIAKVTEAGPSSQWHGIRAFIETADGMTLEVRETVDHIMTLLGE